MNSKKYVIIEVQKNWNKEISVHNNGYDYIESCHTPEALEYEAALVSLRKIILKLVSTATKHQPFIDAKMNRYDIQERKDYFDLDEGWRLQLVEVDMENT